MVGSVVGFRAIQKFGIEHQAFPGNFRACGDLGDLGDLSTTCRSMSRCLIIPIASLRQGTLGWMDG